MTFQANYLATVFKVVQYGFEIFQTVLSLNCKIIELKILNLVINSILISDKALCFKISIVSNTNLMLL